MKIAFINNNAGDATLLAKELACRKHETDVFVFDAIKQKQWGGIKIDYRVRSKDSNGHTTINAFFPFTRYNFFTRLKNYDIWHYQNPHGKLLEDISKHINGQILIKHYEGSDIRGRFDDDPCIVSTPDLLSYAPNGTWIRSPIEVNYVSRFKRLVENKIPKVAHYPYYLDSPKLAKDEETYKPVLTNLEKKGKCQVVNIIRQTHEKTIQMLAECDIVVGKIMPDVGWFGKFEVEGMVLEKPVIAYVAKDLFDKYKPPIHNTTEQTFEKDLEALIEDKTEQRRLVKEGYTYASHHDTINVANKVEAYYRRVM